MEIPDDLHYTKEHEWVRVEPDGTVTIGITDYAQEQLGDIVFVELPKPDDETFVLKDEAFAVVESVKAASDVYSPITGKVIESNDDLPDNPNAINEDPYGDGWLVRLEPKNVDDVEDLMTSEEYEELVEGLED
ncbi:MAG: glycine cleavage system protein GcvH [Deltaproteobacteria bacterium]|nr:glycine cleavage system protein GcvH [Deltaproteobacteria bacterium]